MINSIMDECNISRINNDIDAELYWIDRLITFIVFEISDEWRQTYWRTIYKLNDMISISFNTLSDDYDDISKEHFIEIERLLVNFHILKNIFYPSSAWNISPHWEHL